MTVTHKISLEFSIMIVWGQLNLQEGIRVTIELLNYFHDYMIVILILIITFVTYMFGYVSVSPYIDKYTVDSHVLETVWTVVPMFILLFIAFPSLYLLYLIEEVSKPSLSVKVVGHQWYWEYQYSNSWFNHSFDSYIVQELRDAPLFYNLDVDNRLVLPIVNCPEQFGEKTKAPSIRWRGLKNHKRLQLLNRLLNWLYNLFESLRLIHC
jgi:cytochrome c oxidase subunit 2